MPLRVSACEFLSLSVIASGYVISQLSKLLLKLNLISATIMHFYHSKAHYNKIGLEK